MKRRPNKDKVQQELKRLFVVDDMARNLAKADTTACKVRLKSYADNRSNDTKIEQASLGLHFK